MKNAAWLLAGVALGAVGVATIRPAIAQAPAASSWMVVSPGGMYAWRLNTRTGELYHCGRLESDVARSDNVFADIIPKRGSPPRVMNGPFACTKARVLSE